MKVDVNVSTLLTELPLLQRFGRVAACGFTAVESWWPDRIDHDELVRAVHDADLQVVLLNFHGGDLAAGDRGVAGHPERQAEFRENVPLALRLAERLQCATLHALVGKHLPGLEREQQLTLAADNVRWAAELASRQGAWIVVEPLNPTDNGACLIQTVEQARAFIQRVARDNVGIQFDTYHLARTEDDLAQAVHRAGSLIRHVQVADDPGRGCPGSGQIDFAGVFEALVSEGYPGEVGLEYVAREPGGDFAWLPPALRGSDLKLSRLAAWFGELRR